MIINVKKIDKMNDDEILNFIESNLPIKQIEKNKYGEVFTNHILINKILDLFPNTIWSNPELKWLDPSVGIGFFMIFVYKRLMDGLKIWEKNEQKRSNHIIKNMIYMVEINNKNCNVCKSIFGENLNIFCGDFMSDIVFKGYDDLSFDCILGNPPFQDDYGKNKSGKRINGGKNKLYERIFLKSLSILKKDGYLSFIVPDNIFSGNGSLSYQKIIENYVPFISFNPSNQSFFPDIQQSICYFLLQKLHSSKLTTIENSDNLTFKIKLQNRPVNPIRNWSPYTEQLINLYIDNSRNVVIYNRGKPISYYKGNKYPIIYTYTKNLHTNNIKLAIGYGIKKVIIFSISPTLEFKIDYTGKFGVGPNTFYIPFNSNSEGKKLERFLNSNEYKTLALATKTSRQYLKIAFIEYLNIPKILKNNKTKKHIKSYKNKTRKH